MTFQSHNPTTGELLGTYPEHDEAGFEPSVSRSVQQQRPHRTADWHLDEVVVSFAGHRMHLWGAVDSEGEVFDFLVQASRDKAAALKLLRSRGRLRRRWTSEATSMQTPWHLRPMSTPNALSQYPESGITGAGHATSRQVRRISLLQDFMRDWRRWSKTERATALCLAATLMSGIPALFFAMHLG